MMAPSDITSSPIPRYSPKNDREAAAETAACQVVGIINRVTAFALLSQVWRSSSLFTPFEVHRKAFGDLAETQWHMWRSASLHLICEEVESFLPYDPEETWIDKVTFTCQYGITPQTAHITANILLYEQQMSMMLSPCHLFSEIERINFEFTSRRYAADMDNLTTSDVSYATMSPIQPESDENTTIIA